MRSGALIGIIVIAATLILTLNRPAITAAQDQAAVQDIVSRNIEAAGGADALARVEAVSFSAGPARYTASVDGRMKVRYVLEEPAVYEVLIVSGTVVRRNSLNRVSQLSGVERGRWLCLAKFVGGLFTLKNFSAELTYEGIKNLGPERHHILSIEGEGLRQPRPQAPRRFPDQRRDRGRFLRRPQGQRRPGGSCSRTARRQCAPGHV